MMKKTPPILRTVYIAPWRVGGDTVTGLFRYGAKKPEIYSGSAVLMARVAVAINKIMVSRPPHRTRPGVTNP